MATQPGMLGKKRFAEQLQLLQMAIEALAPSIVRTYMLQEIPYMISLLQRSGRYNILEPEVREYLVYIYHGLYTDSINEGQQPVLALLDAHFPTIAAEGQQPPLSSTA